MIMYLLSVLPLILLLQSRAVFGELFTAMSDVEGLVNAELELMRHLDNYIQAEELRLRQLKSFLEDYEDLYQEASADVSKYVANPVNAFRLVKRLTADWKQVEGVMTQNVGTAFVRNITQHRGILRLPTDEDLNGAATALMRLQDMYLLDTHALAEGELQGKKYGSQLSAGDCFELGKQSYNNGDHYHTVLWMGEALRKQEEEANKTVTRQDILEYLAFSTFKQGNVKEALQLTIELLKLVPFHQRAQGNKKYYEDILRSQGFVSQKRGEMGDNYENQPVNVEPLTEPFSVANLKLIKPVDNVPEREAYEKLCRGEKLMSDKLAARLRCRYTTRNVPFYTIMPLKMEEAYLDPYIVVFHEVIFDDEIETIKKMAAPRFKRATVQNYKTGELEPANYRVSKTAWLKSEEHDHVFRVTRRIGAITGLDMATAEDLQVSNYGLGGHYDPHFDHARPEEKKAFASLGWGNRIATWLTYMSDVEAGGATVFPSIKVGLFPRKGSAAFWHNLHRNGEGNELTRHAACPVLQGSKWVSNKWIHEYRQEFRRPCGTRYDE